MTHRSCEWIEYGLAFQMNDICHCCIYHHLDKGWVRICDFHGGKLPVKEIVDARRRMVDVFRKGTPEKCEGCVCIREFPDEGHEYLFSMLNFNHYRLCNVRCDYCYIKKDEDQGGSMGDWRQQYDIYPAVVEMIENRWLNPKAIVHWGGGEPTLLPGFDEILQTLIDYGTMNYVNTNGTVLSNAILENVHKPNISVCISLDSGTREGYRKVKNRDFHDRVIQNLEIYAKASGQGNVGAKYVITDDNCVEKEMDGFVDTVMECEVKTVTLDVDCHLKVIPEKHVDFARKMREKLVDKRVHVIVGASGTSGYPENNFRGKVEDPSQ